MQQHAGNPNRDAIAIIDEIARRRRHIAKGGKIDYRGLAQAAGRSSRALDAVLEGRRPQAETLIDLARYGEVNPLHLFRAVGWVTENDIEDVCAGGKDDASERQDRSLRLIETFREARGLSDRDLADARALFDAILDRQRQLLQQSQLMRGTAPSSES